MISIFHHSPNRLHGLDHLRAVAILLVMIFHFGKGVPSWLEPVRQIGWTGVDLFFVLSGYLIGMQLLKEYKITASISFKQFYLKRFFRIIPAFLAVLVVYYSLPTLHEGKGLPPLWRFLTFTQNFGLDVQTQNSFSHAWSLCIEEQFYLLLPLLIVGVFFGRLQKMTPLLMLVLVVLGMVLRHYHWNTSVQPFIDAGEPRKMATGFIGQVYYPTFNRMDGLLMGVGIATLFNFRPGFRAFIGKYGNTTLLVGLLLFSGAYWVCKDFISYRTAVFGFPAISLAYAVLVLAAISPSSILYNTPSTITFVIATLSYSTYLIHKQLYFLAKTALEVLDLDLAGSLVFWICIAVSLVGGFVLFLVVEKPFLMFRKRMVLQLEAKQDARVDEP